MAVKDAAAVAAKWRTNLSAATTSITTGVQAVTQSPGARAAASVDLWLARVQASRDKWVRNTNAVSLASWQQAMIEKGIPRIASGASAAEPRMAGFMQQFLPYVEQGAVAVRAMPKGDVEQGIQRAAAMIRHNAQFQYRRTAV